MPRRLVPAPPGMKFCPYCRAVHPVADFAPEAGRSDGLRPYCRRGNAAHRRAAYHRNRLTR